MKSKLGWGPLEFTVQQLEWDSSPGPSAQSRVSPLSLLQLDSRGQFRTESSLDSSHRCPQRAPGALESATHNLTSSRDVWRLLSKGGPSIFAGGERWLLVMRPGGRRGGTGVQRRAEGGEHTCLPCFSSQLHWLRQPAKETPRHLRQPRGKTDPTHCYPNKLPLRHLPSWG